MVSKGQIKLIHLAKGRLGLSSDEYREVLDLYGGVRSSKDLTPEGFFKVMEHFRELGFTSRDAELSGPPVRPEQPGSLVEMVTPGQRAKIHQLEVELGWSENPERLRNFIIKRFRVSKVGTKEQAIKVIEALKAILAREKPTAGTGM